jgi:hypothetical protein
MAPFALFQLAQMADLASTSHIRIVPLVLSERTVSIIVSNKDITPSHLLNCAANHLPSSIVAKMPPNLGGRDFFSLFFLNPIQSCRLFQRRTKMRASLFHFRVRAELGAGPLQA